MKSNYKKLGTYIREVDIRNDADIKENLLGVSTQKIFIPSIANTIGTDFTKYKVVKRNQFAYVPDTSRRGDKIGMALLQDFDTAIVSQAYTVFEISDTNELLPEYLMMWFRRPEFDRYARYMSHGSVRELFGWDELCGVELPIPDITEQQKTVDEYNVLCNRITLNEQMNQKLEETAQAIYKQWFVDFEFPNEDGQPYKSSGGEFEETKGADIPKISGWEFDTIEKLGDVVGGSTPSKDVEEYYTTQGISWITPRDISKSGFKFIEKGEIDITESGYKNSSTRLMPKGSVLFSSRAPIGYVAIANNELCTNQGFKSIVPNEGYGTAYVYYFLKLNVSAIANEGTGSTFDEVSASMMRNIQALIPPVNIRKKFDELCRPFFLYQAIIEKTINILNDLKNLLLQKMTIMSR